MSSSPGPRRAPVVIVAVVVFLGFVLAGATAAPGVVATGDAVPVPAVDRPDGSSSAGSMVIDSEVTFDFSKYDGSLGNGDPFTQTVEANSTTDQMSFTDWRIDEFDDPDFGVNLNDTGPDSVFSDPNGDSFQFVSFTTEVFCGNWFDFDVVGYEDGTQVSGATESFNLSQGTTAVTRSVGFASVDEVRFEGYTTDNGNQCLKIDDIIVDQADASNTAPSFSNLDATVVYDEAAGTPVVVDADATVTDTEHDGAGDYAGSTLTVAREGGANADDDFGFDTGAGTFTVSGGDLLSGGNAFASFTDSGGTLTVNFDSSETMATPGLVDDVLQGIEYQNTGDPTVVEYGLTATFDDGGLQTSESVAAEFDPDLTAIGTSTTLDFTALGPELSNLDTVDGRVIEELLFYGFQFGDAAESGSIDSNELQFVDVTPDPATTGVRFESDANFSLVSMDIDNFDPSSQDVTVHGYVDGTLVDSRSFAFGASSGYQTKQFSSVNPAFQAVDEIRLTTSVNDNVAIDNVVVNVSNQAPTLDLDTGAGGSDSAVTFAENDHQGTATSDGVNVTGPFSASDPDGTVESVALTLDNPQGDAGEGLAVDTGPLAADLGFTTSANSITITRNTASEAELVEAIEAVRFQEDDDAPDTTDRTVTVVATDDRGATASATATVGVEAGNDGPSITAPGDTLQPDEDVSFDLDGPNEIQISDPDAGGATIEVTLSADHGTLTLGSTVGLAFDSGGNGQPSFTVSGTLSDLNNALATLDYQGDADYFGPDAVTATVNDRGHTGTDPGQTGDGSSEADSTTVSLDVQSVPDAPTISAIADLTTNEDENASGIAFTVDDAETAPGSLTLSFSADDPSLIASHTFGGSGPNRILEIVPAADQNGATTVTVEVSDGSLTGESDFLLTIDAVNDVPTLTPVPSDDTVDEDTTVPTISFDVDDVETAPGSLTVTASSDDQTLVPDANLALGGTGTDRQLDVTLAENESGTANVTISVDDGTDTVDETFQLTVNAVNDAPAITNTPADTVNEDATYSYTPTVDDPDAGDTTTFSIENKSGWMNFDNATGELSGTPANGDVGTHAGIEITVTDDAGANGTVGPFSVEVVNVNQPPAIGALDGDTATVVEGSLAAEPIDVDADATVTNPDSTDYDGGSLHVQQTSGTTNGDFGVDGTSITVGGDATIAAGESVAEGGIVIGVVDGTDDGQAGNSLTIDLNAQATDSRVEALVRNLVYSADSGLGTRDFALTLNDGDGTANGGDEEVTVTVSVEVTPDPPVIFRLDGDAVTFTEGDAPRSLDADPSADLTDPDSPDFDGGDITVDIVSGRQAEDRLVIATGGAVALPEGQSPGDPVVVDGDSIGTIAAGSSGQSNEPLIVDLNASATSSSVREVLRALQYDNAAGNDPIAGVRTVRLNVTDSGTDPATSEDADVNVTVVAVNDAPTITNAPGVTVTVAEDALYSYTPTVDDPDAGDTTTFDIENEPAWAGFDESTGELSGTPTNDDVGNHTGIEIEVTDAAGANDTVGPFAIDVTNVNDAPAFGGDVALPPVERAVAPANNTGSRIDSQALFGDEFADVDAGDALGGVVVTDDAATGGLGTWEYSTDGGASWHAVDDGSLSANTGLLLSAATRLRFAPLGPVGDPGNLTVFAVDDSGSTTFTSGTTRETYDTTADGPTAVAAATGTELGVEVVDGREPTFANASRVNLTAIRVTIDEDLDLNESTVEPADFSLSAGSIDAIVTVENGTGANVTLRLASRVNADDVEVGIAGSIEDASGNGLTSGTLTVSGMDGVAPTVADVAVSNPSGRNLVVAVAVDEQLSALDVAVGGAGSANLTLGNFTGTATGGGNYTYTASYVGSSDGTYEFTVESAVDLVGRDGAGNESANATVRTRTGGEEDDEEEDDSEADDGDRRFETVITDRAPDAPGTTLELSGTRWVRSVVFESDGATGSFALLEYHEPPASAVAAIARRIAEQRGGDGDTGDDGTGPTTVAVVDISPADRDVRTSGATVVFAVPRDAVTDPGNLVVFHETAAGTWEELDTTVRERTDDVLIVVATVGSFSRFAVVELPEPRTTTTTATPSPTTASETTTRPRETATVTTTASRTSPATATTTDAGGQPGFGPVVAVVALLAAALLAVRRRSD